MSLVAAKVSADVLYDMLEIVEAQTWVKGYLDEFSDLWNICDHRSEQVLLKELIKEFVILDSAKERKAYKDLDANITAWSLRPETTWIVAACNDKEIDGSVAAMQKLKNKLTPYDDWHVRMLPSIPSGANSIRSGDFVVLFDDFIGSGGKLITKAKWLTKLLSQNGVKDFTLFYMSVAGMRFGCDRIAGETGCEVFTAVSLERAISDKYEPEVADEYKRLMLGLEQKLHEKYKKKKIEDYSFGFSKSEALYCVENDNCPNNVFPVFWWARLKSGDRFRTLLRRAG
ncbi:phosphoribosyltransferase-like protein [Pseudomonas entomophila]|uniref:phosphoribosyltransferase-like protein n=1 Tax=Pseudomonas entomophila TaxID=312306 RepID=UPI003EBA9406